MSIAAAIIERYQTYGWSEPPGEWGAIHNCSRREYHDVLERGDTDALQLMLGRMFIDAACAGIVTFDQRHANDDPTVDYFKNDVCQNLCRWMEHTSSTEDDISRLEAPQVGSPCVIDVDGIGVMYDTPRHDHYAQRIISLLQDGGVVFEIGGGYGGTALQILRSSENIRVVLCDLPETLYFAWHWLDNSTDRSVAWHDDDPFADVVLLPAHEIKGWYKADVVFAAHSLSEFTLPVVQDYMEWIQTRLPRYFYHDNVHSGNLDIAVAPGHVGTYDIWPEVMSCDMDPGDSYREVYRAPTLWRGTGQRYWEFLYELCI